jgi:hypothetical protein
MEDEEEGQKNECYKFNIKLMKKFDDGSCEHCEKWLTTHCDKIDEFVDDIEALDDCE